MFFWKLNRKGVKDPALVEDGALRRPRRRAQRQAAQRKGLSTRQYVRHEIIRSALAPLRAGASQRDSPYLGLSAFELPRTRAGVECQNSNENRINGFGSGGADVV
jgi:hypothetical protein